MRIAENTGMSLEQASSLSVYEVSAWAARYSKEPAPLERIEVGIAYLCSLIYNQSRGKGKKAKRASDFLLFKDAWGTAKLPISDDEDVNDDINTFINAVGKERVVIRNPDGGDRQS